MFELQHLLFELGVASRGGKKTQASLEQVLEPRVEMLPAIAHSGVAMRLLHPCVRAWSANSPFCRACFALVSSVLPSQRGASVGSEECS